MLYWKLINIDKSEELGGWGWGGEHCLFDGAPGVLLLLLDLIQRPLQQQQNNDVSPQWIGSWAGDRIICVGDGTMGTPDGMLNEAELKKLSADTAYAAAISNLPDYTYDPNDFGEIEICLFELSGESFNGIYHDDEHVIRPDNHVLRNLTKHEYVRADAIAPHSTPYLSQPPHTERPLLEMPGLGEVILSRISWSSGTNAAMRYDGIKFKKGIWAGDRFDIQTIDTVEGEDGDDEKWKDVSEEVAKEIFALWESEHGKDWWYKPEGDGTSTNDRDNDAMIIADGS